MAFIHTEIEIDAPTERVWDVLTDFASYPAWNPFVRTIQGEPKKGSRLLVRLQPEGRPTITLRPVLLKADINEELIWLGRLPIPGLFDGEHRFRLEKRSPDKTHFVQEENFQGLLVPVFMKLIGKGTKASFEAMNLALKQRAETR